MRLPELTIGVEEEYQIVHPETRELDSYIQEFLDSGRVILRDQIKPEFLQSQVEVGSNICNIALVLGLTAVFNPSRRKICHAAMCAAATSCAGAEVSWPRR